MVLINQFRKTAAWGLMALFATILSTPANGQSVQTLGSYSNVPDDFFDQVLLGVSAESPYMTSLKQPGCAPYAGCTDTMRDYVRPVPAVPQAAPPSMAPPATAQPFVVPAAPVALAGLQSRAPMIGDFFGVSNCGFLTIQPGSFRAPSRQFMEPNDPFMEPNDPFMEPNEPLIVPDAIVLPVTSVGAAPGGNVGRLKLGENTSPIPRDRVFVNYSYFDNTPLTPTGVNVNRVTPGFEKTFFDGNMSFELRAPFASTLDSTIMTGMTNTDHVEFGNLTMYTKALLWRNRSSGLSAGLGTAVPTASDVEAFSNGTQILNIENEGVHLLPFVGGYYMPDLNSRLFMQGILQFDVDVNGNPASVSTFENGLPTGNLQSIGTGRDALYMFLDVSVGYWIYRTTDCSQWIRGVAPMLELHYNRTLDDADALAFAGSDGTIVTTCASDIDLTNAVIGLTTLLGDDCNLTVGYGTPLHGHNQQFDGELRVLFNWYFGGRAADRFLPPSY